MKKIISIFAVLLLVACNGELQEDHVIVGHENSYRYGMSYAVQTTPLAFSITEILDSRCPSDVICIWQGEARIELTFTSPSEGTLELRTYDNVLDTFAQYSFELLAVDPYPVSTDTIKLEDYRVKLDIRKL